MQSRTWISTLLLTGLFALISTASNGQEAIGSTTSVKPQAEAIHGRFRPEVRLFEGVDLHRREWRGEFAISRQLQSQCGSKIERPAR